MKAVIYARYSSDNQREESIEGQLRECKEYADHNDITVIETYIDRALSAKTDNRPSFQRMIKDSYKNLFDVVISADDVDSPKPNPEGIYKAMEKVGIKNKGDVLYIGDNDIDYFTANNAGVDCLLVTWGPREIKCLDKAKYQAKSYNELKGILI